MTTELIVTLGFLWLCAAGLASGFAKSRGWGQWKWFFGSLATGPVVWLVLYLNNRDMKERLGPPDARSQYL